MKTRLILLTIIYAFLLPSCTNEFADISEYTDEHSPATSTRTNPALGQPNYSQNELVVQFPLGTTPLDKDILRQMHNVLTFEACQLCPDETIEKWFFANGIQIEPKKKVIEDMGGLEDVDFEFDYTPYIGDVVVGSPGDISYEPFIKTINTGLTIAVLDTGLDHFFPFCYGADEVTPKPLLYNADDTAVAEEEYGWDFVDHDPNAFDDYGGKHGSIVSSIINQILNEASIPHQIMPLKIADNTGSISYFDMVCAYNYAGPRVDLIQMSLGWYDDGLGDFENTIFRNLTDTYSDVLVVTSAGNSSNNNEVTRHYPSSYENANILAVGSTNVDGSDIAYFSNYGDVSVDFFAQGADVPFYNYDNELISPGFEGTSFAAPQIAGKAAQLIYENEDFTLSVIINLLETEGLPTIEYMGKSKYNKYYPLLVE